MTSLSSLPARQDGCAPAGELVIDLAAVVENWQRLRRQMPAGKDVAGVVKANAYGLGAVPVAQALARAGCRTFFVAEPSEGLALRPHLPPDSVIYVLTGPLPGDDAGGRNMVVARLSPVLNSLPQLALWLAEAPPEAPFAVHFDTGMSRLGVEVEEAAAVAAMASPALVMSHLACADEPEHVMNRQQLDRFRQVRQLFPDALASLANSSGLYLGEEWCFDLGRPGLGLYGGNPLPGKENPLQEVVTLSVRILQVRHVDTPRSVGYGATHTTGPERTTLAVVGAGYADGLPRTLGNRGRGLLGGVPVPVVGRVSMDLTTFDVTAAAPELARVGEHITLIGGSHSVDDLADEAGTISYELLTALGRRYARRYKGD